MAGLTWQQWGVRMPAGYNPGNALGVILSDPHYHAAITGIAETRARVQRILQIDGVARGVQISVQECDRSKVPFP